MHSGCFDEPSSRVQIPAIETKAPPNGDAFLFGGEGGIRTLERVLAVTRFPIVRLRPAQPPLQKIFNSTI